MADWPAAVRHEPLDGRYNRSIRQLVHVAYSIAAKELMRFIELIEAGRATVSANVTHNLLERHLL
ncbi:MAG: hypothetical protein H7X89_07090 [Rhizobiales bacterium]|nr:hypothetical protein [Hyphomicrobiales bacterium]